MHEKLTSYFEQAMEAVTSDREVLNRLFNARKIYEKLTGKIDEDDDEYESRMLNFNEWFLFDFIEEDRQMPFIIEFLNTLDGPVEDVKKLFSRVNYSFFECQKKALGFSLTVQDFLKGEKFKVKPKHFPVQLLSDEIFTGRAVNCDGDFYFLPGVRWLPKEIRPPAVKKAKQIRKLGDPSVERKFTLDLERVMTKCIQFKHVRPSEVFSSVMKESSV